MARDDDVWDAVPELQKLGHGLRWLWRHLRLVAAVVVLWAAVAAWSVDSRFRIPLAVVGLPVVWWMLTEPAQFAVFVGLRRAPVVPVGEPVMPSGPIVPPRRHLVPAPPPVDGLHSLKVGRVIGTGKDWTVNLLGASLFVAGLPESGKSVFLRALMESMAEWVRHGEVVFWGLDPKMVEFMLAAPLFAQDKLWTPLEEPAEHWGRGAAEMLEDAMEEMGRRYRLMVKMRKTTLTPSVENPFLVVWIDEIASLLQTRPKAKPEYTKRIMACLEPLAREGRAAAMSLVIATQEPRKNKVDIRDITSERVCFRQPSVDYGDMVLYTGAAKDGATPHLIPRKDHGVAYAAVEDEAGVVTTQKVLTHLVDEERLEELVVTYAAPRAA